MNYLVDYFDVLSIIFSIVLLEVVCNLPHTSESHLINGPCKYCFLWISFYLLLVTIVLGNTFTLTCIELFELEVVIFCFFGLVLFFFES